MVKSGKGPEEYLLPIALGIVQGKPPTVDPHGALSNTELLLRWQFTTNHVIGSVVGSYGSGGVPIGYQRRLLQLLNWQREHGHQTVCGPDGEDYYRWSEQASTVYSSHWCLYMAASWAEARRVEDVPIQQATIGWWQAMLALWRLLEVNEGQVAVVAPRSPTPFDYIADGIMALARGQQPQIRYKKADGQPTDNRPSWAVWAVERLGAEWREAMAHVVADGDDWEQYIPKLRHPIWVSDDRQRADVKGLPNTSPGRISYRSGANVWDKDDRLIYSTEGQVYGEGAETVSKPTDTKPVRPPERPAPSPTAGNRTLPSPEEIDKLSNLSLSAVYGATRFGWHLDSLMGRKKEIESVKSIIQYAIAEAKRGDWGVLDIMRRVAADSRD